MHKVSQWHLTTRIMFISSYPERSKPAEKARQVVAQRVHGIAALGEDDRWQPHSRNVAGQYRVIMGLKREICDWVTGKSIRAKTDDQQTRRKARDRVQRLCLRRAKSG